MRFPKRTTLTHLIIAVYIRNWISKPFKDIFVIKKKKETSAKNDSCELKMNLFTLLLY